jgi:hypothetical protein
MMMAHDSTPDRPQLDEASLSSLRSALQKFVANTDTVALDRELRRLAAEARAKHILAEQLLVVLKDAWFAIPEIRDAENSDEQTRLLQRVVTLCIRAYYAA